jgi:CheY-like chemotaxis protein
MNGLRVLIVDDNADTRDLMAIFLGAEGLTVTLAGSAGEALALLDRDALDILVCDIGLPDIDGCALLRTVRDRPAERGGTIPAIALTGYSEPEVRYEILTAGYHEHLVKPVEPQQLVHAIARVVAGGKSNATNGC